VKRELAIAVLVLVGATAVGLRQNPATRRLALTEPTKVGAFTCAPGKGGREPRAFQNGALAQCQLAQPADFFGHLVDSGTFIYLHEDGTPQSIWLVRDTRIDGHLCRGTGHGGWSVDFHPDGRLAGCYLAKPEVIAGVPCMKGTFWNEVRGGVHVAFHPNGRLEHCTTARPITLGPYSFRARTQVRLDPDGQVIDPASYGGAP
jgi:hypothetical protein